MQGSRLTRILLVLLGLPNVFAGAWAIISPQGWYDNFPGYAPSLISAYPPFNQHLAFDAGSGLFAAGVLAIVAAVLMRRDVIITAMVGTLAFVVPHTLFHIFKPADLLSTGENISTAASLGFSVALAVYILGRQFIGQSNGGAKDLGAKDLDAKVGA